MFIEDEKRSNVQSSVGKFSDQFSSVQSPNFSRDLLNKLTTFREFFPQLINEKTGLAESANLSTMINLRTTGTVLQSLQNLYDYVCQTCEA